MAATDGELDDHMAKRHSVSPTAVQFVLMALRRGGGRAAQFSHADFGGMSQWSPGMSMVEHAWTLPFAACKLGLGGFECAQALLPLALQAASDQPVVWIDGTVAALGAARIVACPLDAETPLLERGLAICFEPLGSGERGPLADG